MEWSDRLRGATRDDVPAVHALLRRMESADGLPVVTSLAEVDEQFTDPTTEPADDMRVLDGPDGTIVAYGAVYFSPSGSMLERAFLEGGVDPEWRGQGIGRELFGWQVARGTERLSAVSPELPAYLRADAYDWLAGAHSLYQHHGFEQVRWFEELLRDLSPVAAPPAEGIEIVAWDPDRSEEVRLVHNAAFADHWGSVATGPEAWQHRLHGHGARLDTSVLALDGGAVVGYSLNHHYPDDEALLGRRDGWIGTLGTMRSHRKRGIASALVAASIDRFREAGFTHASIGVDSSNPSGAAGLYRRLGFEPTFRSITSQRVVREPSERPSDDRTLPGAQPSTQNSTTETSSSVIGSSTNASST